MITKKQLNAIKHAAFEEFKSGYTKEEWEALFAGVQKIMVYKFEMFRPESEGGAIVERHEFQYSTQLNDEFLRKHGFDPERTKFTHLFDVVRQTKTVEFVNF